MNAMNIAICLKQVPDTADLRLDPETNTLIREGVAAVLNPLDEFPMEAALRLRDSVGGRITAFTMGPFQAVAVLRRALAMGVDDAVLVCDRCFAGADTWATSLTLAAGLKKRGPFDVVLCGKQAIDGDTAQVGPGIAAHLGLAQITYVTDVQTAENGKKLRVQRMLDHGIAELNVEPPVVLTVLKEANEPRLPTLSNRLRSYRQEIETLTLEDLGLSAAEVGLDGSPTQVVRIAVPEATRAHRRIEGTAERCADELMKELEW